MSWVWAGLLLASSGLALPAEISPNLPERLTCYTTVFEPFVLSDPAGLGGVDVELVEEIGRRLGLEIEVRLMPWLRLEAAVRERDPKVQCAFAYFRTPERLDYMTFMSEPLHVTEYVLFVRAAEAAGFASIGALREKAVAVNRGFQVPDAIARAQQEGRVTLQAVTQEEQSFKMLALGRVDAVLTHRKVGTYVLGRLGLPGIVALEAPLSTAAAFLVFPLRAESAAWSERFDAALRAVEEDGTAASIRDRYGIPPPDPSDR